MFVDSAKEAIDVLKANAEATGFFSASRYLVSDYRNFLRKYAGRERYDLVFIDPPYAMECAKDAVERLLRSDLVAKGALVVLEVGTEPLNFSEAPFVDFEVEKFTNYGKKTAVAVLFYKGKSEEEGDE